MSKYKFDLTTKAKTTVEWILERYHEDKRELEIYKRDEMPAITQGYSQTSGVSSSNISNPTANVAIRIATSPYILWTERNTSAIDRVLDKLSDTDKNLIDLVYWKKSHNVIGAGKKVGLSPSKAYVHINNILGMLALEIGVVNM